MLLDILIRRQLFYELELFSSRLEAPVTGDRRDKVLRRGSITASSKVGPRVFSRGSRTR